MGLDAHVRVEPGDHVPGALDLGGADVGRIVHDLALQVVEGDPVVVDDADSAHARRGQIHQQRRAEPAGADHQHFGRLDLLLALAADLAQHQVALVTLDLLGC